MCIHVFAVVSDLNLAEKNQTKLQSRITRSLQRLHKNEIYTLFILRTYNPLALGK